jgi:undecaprenyl-diphosphatase
MGKIARIRFILLSIIFGLIYLFLNYLVGNDSFRTVDYQSMTGAQSIISRLLDYPFSILTLLGSSEITLFILTLIFLYILIRKRHFFLGIFIFGSLFIIELLGKLTIYHPKPPAGFLRYALDFNFPSSNLVPTQYSFPSGHMARTTFIVIICIFLISRYATNIRKKIFSLSLMTLLIISILISRVYLGEHWLSDVLGGLVLGSAVATFALSLW